MYLTRSWCFLTIVKSVKSDVQPLIQETKQSATKSLIHGLQKWDFMVAA